MLFLLLFSFSSPFLLFIVLSALRHWLHLRRQKSGKKKYFLFLFSRPRNIQCSFILLCFCFSLLFWLSFHFYYCVFSLRKLRKTNKKWSRIEWRLLMIVSSYFVFHFLDFCCCLSLFHSWCFLSFTWLQMCVPVNSGSKVTFHWINIFFLLSTKFIPFDDPETLKMFSMIFFSIKLFKLISLEIVQ